MGIRTAPETPSAPRVIESASASTACQTTASKTAYLLTAGVLGFAALFICAIALLLFTATSAERAWTGASYGDASEYVERAPRSDTTYALVPSPTTSSSVIATLCGVGTQSTLRNSAATVIGT